MAQITFRLDDDQLSLLKKKSGQKTAQGALEWLVQRERELTQEKMNRQLRDKLRGREIFDETHGSYDDVCDKILNPITAIIGVTHILSKEQPENDLLDRIKILSERIGTYVRSLDVVAKSEAYNKDNDSDDIQPQPELQQVQS